MCIITILPAGVALTLEQVKDAMTKNPHGVGVMYSKDGQLYTGRTMSSSPKKVRRWLANCPIELQRVVHFRKTTAGATNRDNLHPFEVHARFGVMHNGTLDDDVVERDWKDSRSDTNVFADEVLGAMTEEMLTNAAVWKLLCLSVDDNRIIMLDGLTGTLTRTSEQLWTKGIDDIELSNTYSIERGEVWGVTKKTFHEFFRRPGQYAGWRGYSQYGLMDDDDHAYGTWNGVKYVPGLASPPPPAKPLYTPPRHPVYMPQQQKKEYYPIQQKKVSTDDEVMRNVYVSYNGDERIPCSGLATHHPLYGVCAKLCNEIELPHVAVAASTMLIALLHAKLTDSEIRALSPAAALKQLKNLLDFTRNEPSPHMALHAKFKEIYHA